MKIIRAGERSERDLMREVAACVSAGGTVIFPTETVYGIGCDPNNPTAIHAVYAAKGRSSMKPLALHVTNIAQALPFVSELNMCARAAIERLWPGPVAIVVKRRDDRYEYSAAGLPTISLRCPSDDLCRKLLQTAGPLAATSANRSGYAPFTGEDDQISDLPQASIAVLAGATALRRESTVIDCTGERPRIIREAAVPATVIVEKLGTCEPVR